MVLILCQIKNVAGMRTLGEKSLLFQVRAMAVTSQTPEAQTHTVCGSGGATKNARVLRNIGYPRGRVIAETIIVSVARTSAAIERRSWADTYNGPPAPAEKLLVVQRWPFISSSRTAC